jgi:hypothetical protein
MAVDWAPAMCFGMLFLIGFAVLQSATMALVKQKIDFGVMPERVGRVVFGLLLGYVISGAVLLGASMGPLSANYPYQRFDASRPDIEKPGNALLNPDGFLAGFFGIISGGSVSGTQSFAVLHAGFTNELSLNRLPLSQKMKTRTDSHGITMSAKSVWSAPGGLKDTEGNLVSSKPNYELVIVRVGFTNSMIAMDGALTPSQLRFQCKKKGEKPRLGGSAVSVYPVGYLKGDNQVKITGLSERIAITQNAQSDVVPMDFVCYVPKDYEPVAVGLKSNAITEAPPMVTAEQAMKELAPAAEVATPSQDANAAK